MSTFNLQTGAAKEVANAQFSFTIFSEIDKIANICSDPNISDGAISKRLEISIKVLINCIPSSTTREELKRIRKERVLEAKNSFINKSLTKDEYNDLLIDINTDTLGEIVSVLDNLLGIVETQYVMPMLSPEIKSALEKRFYGEGDPDENIE